MNTVTKFFVLAAVAAFGFAASAIPSEAAKKKETAACQPVTWCSAACQGSTCEVQTCEGGKWVASIVGRYCMGTNCPPKCK